MLVRSRGEYRYDSQPLSQSVGLTHWTALRTVPVTLEFDGFVHIIAPTHVVQGFLERDVGFCQALPILLRVGKSNLRHGVHSCRPHISD